VGVRAAYPSETGLPSRRGSSLTTDPGTALADFSGRSTVAWQGFDELTQGGTPIPFTVTSESGTDWTQPVPEPGAWLAGAVALLALARRAYSAAVIAS
jgi:MYXO-CTERM domain-containing protein